LEPGSLFVIADSLQRAFVADGKLAQAGVALSVLEGTIEISGGGVSERIAGVGFEPLHRRWLARVLANESRLVQPDASWLNTKLNVDAERMSASFSAEATGEDDYGLIGPWDFFPRKLLSDELDALPEGVPAVLTVPEIGMLTVPDLYARPLPRPVSPAVSRPDFGICDHQPPEPPPTRLCELELDPSSGPDLLEIVNRQRDVARLAARQTTFVALLDVPPELSEGLQQRWRAALAAALASDQGEAHGREIDPSYSAAYHPWILVDRPDDGRNMQIAIPPSAVAAGIIARRERELGLPHGPANELVRFALDVAEAVPVAVRTRLHASGVNVFLKERDGIRLTAARTLANQDREYSQLSVRRLLIMMRRTLLEQLQWVAFEPHDELLRQKVKRSLESWLRQLYRSNAFVGSREEEAFFVQCDEQLNHPHSVRRGELHCHVGVAPAEPLEFIVVNLQRDGDGTLRLEG
jgi:uncharacterized protein